VIPFVAPDSASLIGEDVKRENFQQPNSYSMPLKKQNPSEADLLSSIRNLDKWKEVLGEEEKLGEDWLSIEQICKLLNRKTTQAKIKLRQLNEEGKVEIKKFAIFSHGTQVRKNYYRLIL